MRCVSRRLTCACSGRPQAGAANVTRAISVVVVVLAVVWVMALWANDRVEAAEGGASNYLPGLYGDIAVATPPNPGFTLLNFNYFYSANQSRTILQGRANINLNLFAYVNISVGLYQFETPVLGAKFSVGGFIPFGYASMTGTLSTPLGSPSFSTDTGVALGDTGVIPAFLNWTLGERVFINAYEVVIFPTGQYDVNNFLNMGRNYFSFDSVLAMTWFNQDTGTELSAVPGFMVNTENTATDYRTGNEFHLDYMANQFLHETFSIGFHGYYYQQVASDQVNSNIQFLLTSFGKTTSDFKASSTGIGPAASWIPKFGQDRLVISAKWLHDLEATNRLKADYGVMTVMVSF